MGSDVMSGTICDVGSAPGQPPTAPVRAWSRKRGEKNDERKVFIDVGGYHGESSRAALDPRFGFNRIYCFEPVRSCYEHIIETMRDPRLTVFNAGLLDRSAMLPMHQAGSLGGSVYADAPQTGGGFQQCEFIEASTFFSEHIGLTQK